MTTAIQQQLTFDIKTIPIPLAGKLTSIQIDTVLSLVSIAENSSTSWHDQYGYCENIKDGRGYTCGLVGFTTGTSDYKEVLKELAKINPKHELVSMLGAVTKVDGTSSTKGLSALPAMCKKYAKDEQYICAQWVLIKQLYWDRAMDYCDKLGLKSVASKGQMYDTIINFGTLDSIKVKSSIKPPAQGGPEKAWLLAFLQEKERWITKVDKTLDNGQNDRVVLWRNIVNANNYSLDRPLKGLRCYGDKFDIV